MPRGWRTGRGRGSPSRHRLAGWLAHTAACHAGALPPPPPLAGAAVLRHAICGTLHRQYTDVRLHVDERHHLKEKVPARCPRHRRVPAHGAAEELCCSAQGLRPRDGHRAHQLHLLSHDGKRSRWRRGWYSLLQPQPAVGQASLQRGRHGRLLCSLLAGAGVVCRARCIALHRQCTEVRL